MVNLSDIANYCSVNCTYPGGSVSALVGNMSNTVKFVSHDQLHLWVLRDYIVLFVLASISQ